MSKTIKPEPIEAAKLGLAGLDDDVCYGPFKTAEEMFEYLDAVIEEEDRLEGLQNA